METKFKWNNHIPINMMPLSLLFWCDPYAFFGSFWPTHDICWIKKKIYSLSKWYETLYGGNHLLDLQKKLKNWNDILISCSCEKNSCTYGP